MLKGGGSVYRVCMSMNFPSSPRGGPFVFFQESQKGRLICALEMEGAWHIQGRRGGRSSLY